MNKLSFPSTGLTVSPQSENVSFRSYTVYITCEIFFCLIVFHLHMYFPFSLSVNGQRMNNVLPTNFAELRQKLNETRLYR